MRVETDHVYVIPPNREMEIRLGALHLLPAAPRAKRLPIDSFLVSLAEESGNRGIAVLLSGMGADGTLGAQAIRNESGRVFVQDPDTARYDSMPRSVIDAGCADVVAAAELLPARILEPRVELSTQSGEESPSAPLAAEEMAKLIVLLRQHNGHDFSLYKMSTVQRRIERRMSVHQIDSFSTYRRLARENPAELDLLFRELLIGVTSFFRDPAAWEDLRRIVIPELLRRHSAEHPIRIWVPGCSTGEEAYSLAILFREAFDDVSPSAAHKVSIFATDLDASAIERARTGKFPASIASNVSPERLARFFAPVEGGYRIARAIRESIVFAPQNVLSDPPFTKMDLVSCRNLLIYFTTKSQGALLPAFHFSLNPGGFLFLGSAETAVATPALFAPEKGNSRIYRRLESNEGRAPVQASSLGTSPRFVGLEHGRTQPTAGLQAVAEQVLLQHHTSPAVLVTPPR